MTMASCPRQTMAVAQAWFEDFDVAIRRGVPPCNDPLVEEWVSLQALAPYMRTRNKFTKDSHVARTR